MEYNIDKDFLKDLLKNYSRSMVGKLCKQNESLQDSLKGLDKETQDILIEKLEIIKNFNRELVYQSFRDLNGHFKCYSDGREYEKFKLFKPTDTQ